jgi:hypothetical protein
MPYGIFIVSKSNLFRTVSKIRHAISGAGETLADARMQPDGYARTIGVSPTIAGTLCGSVSAIISSV